MCVCVCVWFLLLQKKNLSISPLSFNPCLTPPSGVAGASQSQTIPGFWWGGPDQCVHFTTLSPSARSYNSVSFHSPLQDGT